jgi:hypothetical protein
MTDQERRVLEKLAAADNGCTDALLLGYGFKLEMILEMVSSGLATAAPDRAFVADYPVEVIRVQITEAGGRALAKRLEQGSKGGRA